MNVLSPVEPTVAQRPVLSRLLTGWGIFALIASAFCLGYRYSGHHITVGLIGNNMYYYLLVNYETAQFVTTGCVLLLLAWLVARRPEWLSRILPAAWPSVAPRTATLGLVALGFCFSAVGTYTAYHNFDLCIDEYLPNFQAKLFARGQIFAHVPDEWRPYAPAMTTTFLMYDPTGGRWTQGFLPVYAAIRAVLSFVGLERITGSLLVALSILAIVQSGKRIWPDKPHLWLLSGLLLLANSQVLVAGMTSYAWPAHLALNLVVLWFYLRGGACFWIAPWIGFLAMGLHQPHVHPLFMFPFVLRLALQKRWGSFCYYGVVYATAGAAWFSWLRMARLNLPGGGLDGTFGLPDGLTVTLQWCNLALLLAWSTPFLWILASSAWGNWRRLPSIARDLTFSAGLSFVFYFMFPHDQGHGWGYRFLHGLLGNVALLGAFGWDILASEGRVRMARGLLVASLTYTVLWQLPSRLWEVHSVVGPYAQAASVIENAPFDTVVLDAATGWYASDLVRNDPFLESKPKVMFLHRLNPEMLGALNRRGRITLMGASQFRHFGIPPGLLRRPVAAPAAAPQVTSEQ